MFLLATLTPTLLQIFAVLQVKFLSGNLSRLVLLLFIHPQFKFDLVILVKILLLVKFQHFVLPLPKFLPTILVNMTIQFIQILV